MPRVAGVYSAPSGTKAVSGQTIQSVPYNTFIDDLVTDANNPRPVTAGGTGSNTKTGARTNLGILDDAYTLTNKSLSDSTTFFIDETDGTKKLQFQVSGIATATTRTVTWPDVSGNAVVDTAPQTLTNKAFVDASTSFIDDGDNTKVLKFQLSGIATGTTRTVTFPDASGTVLLDTSSNAPFGKQAIWIPAGAMKARTTNGAAPGTFEMTTNKNMFVTLDFDTSTQEFSQFSIMMPKSWNEGTITFVPVWSHAATTTNFGVVWSLAGVAISDDDAGDAAFGTVQTSTDTGGTTNDLYQGPESSAITIAGSPATNDLVMFQLARVPANVSDTMAIDARLHGVTVFITTDAGNDA